VPDAPVFIAQYDPAWLAGFDGQRDRVAGVLEPWLAAPVEHIGSTSVSPVTPIEAVTVFVCPLITSIELGSAAAA
jgi:GrpB-like predicted nucleotidyltransferase (UPF0157 family)